MSDKISYLVAKDFNRARRGVSADGKGCGPILEREVLGVAIVNNDGFAVGIFVGADAALDPRVEDYAYLLV
jgi:hypothetical protein